MKRVRSSGPRRGHIGATLLALTLAVAAPPARLAAGSDVVMECRTCPVCSRERGDLARLLRAADLVFEGTYLGADSVPAGYERGRPLARFAIRRRLRGVAPAAEARVMPLSWRDLPDSGASVLAWVIRGCTIDAHPCGDYLTITPERTMLHNQVSSDWRPESSLLSCDTLEHDVLGAPDSSGLDAFDRVAALALATLEPRDSVNFRFPGGFPDNGGTWPVSQSNWILGARERAPRFVRFARVPRRRLETEFRAGDRFLLPISPAGVGDTLIASTINWRPMLVRNGEAVGFGVLADSLPSLYRRDGSGYRLALTRSR